MAKRPSPQEIWAMLREIRNEYYPSLNIGNVEIDISNRMTKTAGRVRKFGYGLNINRFLMTISGPYHDEFGWVSELWETLKHEIIHIARPFDGHGTNFYSELHRTGAERYCKLKGRDLKVKAQYRCRACGHIFKSKDRKMFCPICDDLIEQIGTIEEE